MDKGLYSSYKSHEGDRGPTTTSNATSTSGEGGEKVAERCGGDSATSLVSTLVFSCSWY